MNSVCYKCNQQIQHSKHAISATFFLYFSLNNLEFCWTVCSHFKCFVFLTIAFGTGLLKLTINQTKRTQTPVNAVPWDCVRGQRKLDSINPMMMTAKSPETLPRPWILFPSLEPYLGEGLIWWSGLNTQGLVGLITWIYLPTISGRNCRSPGLYGMSSGWKRMLC